MCGSVDMSYACLSVCLCLPFYGIFFSAFFFCTFQLNWTLLLQRNARPDKVCYTSVSVCMRCVFVFGCKLKRSSSHTKTTRTSALMLHLPCLFTASCPFVGHTHTHMDYICVKTDSTLILFFSPLLVFVPLIVCFVLRIHQHWLLLIAVPFSLSFFLPFSLSLSLSRSFSLSFVLCLFVVLLIYAINWHNLWPIVQAKNKKKENIAEFTLWWQFALCGKRRSHRWFRNLFCIFAKRNE